MLTVVREPVLSPNKNLPVVLLRIGRMKLAKRLWRGTAEDGVEFGFELVQPLKHGETFFENASSRYVVEQTAESLLEVALDLPASAAAGIGWAVGNLHLELSSEPTRLLTPDDSAARQLFERIGISYRAVQGVFRPGRFSRGDKTSAPTQELGSSHKHG